MHEHVILIGPIGVGKSTQGRLLAEALGLPRCSMDEVRFRYYAEIGYDEAHAKHLDESRGFRALYEYWKPFEAYAAIRLLEDHPCSAPHVIDFGGGHSVHEDPQQLARVEAALASHPHVVLLIPSSDADASIRFLRERTGRIESDGLDFHEHFVRHSSNARLAKHTVYTAGMSPEQTRDAILCLVR